MILKTLMFFFIVLPAFGEFINFTPDISSDDIPLFGCWDKKPPFKIEEISEINSDKYERNFLCISYDHTILGSILSKKETLLRKIRNWNPVFKVEGKIVQVKNSKKLDLNKCEYFLDVTHNKFSTNEIVRYAIKPEKGNLTREVIINEKNSFKIFLPKNIPDAKNPIYKHIETNIPLLEKLLKVSNVEHDSSVGASFTIPDFQAYDLNEDGMVDIVFLHECGYVIFIISSKDGYKIARGCLPSCG